MLYISICDDEKVFRTDLKNIITTHLDLCGLTYEIEEFSSGKELVENFREDRARQILFLDIEMKGLSGMEAAREIRRRSSSVLLIFVTSYEDFVFQGYDVQAFHYILKPCDKEKIIQVLTNGLKALDVAEGSWFLIEHKKGSQRIPFQKIKYFFSQRHLIHVVTADDMYRFYGKLSDVEETLPDCFVRSHNRYIINLKYLDALENSSAIVDGDAIPVSRSRKQELSAAYARYLLR